MPEGGTLTLEIRDEDNHLSLAVRDTESRREAEAVAHLFEPFVMIRCAGHLGLGLVLCRDLARTQQGLKSKKLAMKIGKPPKASKTAKERAKERKKKKKKSK